MGRIGIIGAADPTRDYSPGLGEELGRRLRRYTKDNGFIFHVGPF